MEMHDTLILSPHFWRVPVGTCQSAFLGERDSYIINSSTEHLEAEMNVGDFVTSAESIQEQSQRYFVLKKLVEVEVLLKHFHGTNIPKFRTPSNASRPMLGRQVHQPEDVAIANLILPDTVDGICDQFVFVDDYLDPSLPDIGTKTFPMGSWMPLKLVGKAPLIGPVFSPGDHDSPCPQCLRTTILGNQPLKKWLLREGYLWEEKIPIAYSSASVERIIPVVRKCLGQIFATRGRNSVYSIDPEDLTYRVHELRKVPDCQYCGGGRVGKAPIPEGIELRRCLKTQDADGGSRSVPAQSTLSRLMPYVSPLTGLVCELNRLPEGSSNSVVVFESAFHKLPASQSRIRGSDFIQSCLGKGLSETQSKVSALSEAIERLACQYRGDEYHFSGEEGGLEGRFLRPDKLALYSEKQYGGRLAPIQNLPEKLKVPRPYRAEEPLDWTICWSLTKKDWCKTPLTYCYANTPFDAQAVIRFNSNGCASGNTREEAILQGFYELIERDATAIWWYNRVPRPSVDMSGMDRGAMRRISAFLKADWNYWVLDLTHDFAIPVLAAIGRHKRTGEFRFGFGCHFNPMTASDRALTELCQLVAIGESHSREFDFRSINPEPYLFPSVAGKTFLQQYMRPEEEDIAEDIRSFIEKLEALDFEILVHDYPRPDFPLSVVKVIVPGLCHIWPQFGNERLYTMPVQVDWRTRRLSEEELNPMALLV